MGYTVGSGQVLRKRLEPRPPGINAKETHAFFITDIEHFVLTAWARAVMFRLDDLASRLLKVGLDWEHFEALMQDDPSERTSENIIELERLAEQTEVLVAEVEVRTGLVDRQGRPFPPVLESRGGDK